MHASHVLVFAVIVGFSSVYDVQRLTLFVVLAIGAAVLAVLWRTWFGRGPVERLVRYPTPTAQPSSRRGSAQAAMSVPGRTPCEAGLTRLTADAHHRSRLVTTIATSMLVRWYLTSTLTPIFESEYAARPEVESWAVPSMAAADVANQAAAYSAS